MLSSLAALKILRKTHPSYHFLAVSKTYITHEACSSRKWHQPTFCFVLQGNFVRGGYRVVLILQVYPMVQLGLLSHMPCTPAIKDIIPMKFESENARIARGGDNLPLVNCLVSRHLLPGCVS